MLHLSLLGRVEIQVDGDPVVGFKSNKAVAVLCYLAVNAEPCPRTKLVEMLWGELPAANGRMNLRKVLSNLRTLLGSHLIITRQTAAFKRNSAYRLDVEQFEDQLRKGKAEDRAAPIIAAMTLYRGDFMDGVELAQADPFEVWLAQQRFGLQRLAVEACFRLSNHFRQESDPDRSIAYLQRLLTLEPWQEEAHRRLMRAYARSGRFKLASAQYRQCQTILAEELEVEPDTETTELFQRIQAASQATRHNLPGSVTPFVGRKHELNTIRRYLDDPDCRLLTLVGPGGIGKTRLALEAAASMVSEFLNGVVFVSLAPVVDSASVVTAIAGALQVPLGPQGPSREQLFQFLRNRELLLLCDNFEHLLPGASILSEILARAPEVTILVTSRTRLKLGCEWLFDVGGLPVPKEDEDDSFDEHSAVQLFVQTARRNRPGFLIEKEDRAVLARICQSVEGMPLAIELAASWTRLLSCTEIAEEIEQGLEILSNQAADLSDRHRDISSVFAHAMHLLPARQQQVLVQLAIFQGSFQRQAAAEVCGASLADLSALLDASWLRRGENGRYQLHELMRKFALAQLGADEHAVRSRHSRYYLQYLSHHEPALFGAVPQAAADAVQAEIYNVHEAWHWTITHGAWSTVDSCLDAWARLQQLRGLYPDAQLWLVRALESLSRQTNGADDTDNRLAILQTRLMTVSAELLLLSAKYSQCRARAEEALTAALEIGQSDLVVKAHSVLGSVFRLNGEYDSAEAHLLAARQLQNDESDSRQRAQVLLQLGKIYEARRAWADALDVLATVQQLYQVAGDSWGIAISWRAMGAVQYGAGQLEQALQSNGRALAIVQELGFEPEWLRCTAEMGKVQWRMGRRNEALNLLEDALLLAENLGMAGEMGPTYRIAGDVARELGRKPAAHGYLQRALNLAQEAEATVLQIDTLLSLAFLNGGERQYEVALAMAKEALVLAEEIDEPLVIAACLLHAGRYHARLGDFLQAQTLLARSVKLHESAGPHPNMATLASALANLADVLYHRGEVAAAMQYAQKAARYIDANAETLFMLHDLRNLTTSILEKCEQAQKTHEEPISANHGAL